MRGDDDVGGCGPERVRRRRSSTELRRTIFRVCALWVGLTGASRAGAESIRVQATAAFAKLSVIRASNTRLQLNAVLVDDANDPVGEAEVQLHLPTGASPFECGSRRRLPLQRSPGGGRVCTVRAAADGSLCLELENSARDPTLGDPPGGRAEFTYAGDEFHTAARADVDLKPRLGALELAFEAPELSFRLNEAEQRVGVRIEPANPAPRPGSSVTLELEIVDNPGQSRPLGSETALVGQTAVFDVPSRLLGGPGAAELVAKSGATDSVGASRVAVPIHKLVLVNLRPSQTELRGFPGTGVEVPLAVESAVGPVTQGWVEVRSQERVVGLGPVAAGNAAPVARFDAPRATETKLSLRYLASEPGWLAAEPTTVTLLIQPPSPWHLWPWLCATTLVGGSVFWGWRRPRRSRRSTPPRRPHLENGPLVVIEARAATSGWTGRVVDAHDGQPIAGARVEIKRAAFVIEAGAGEAEASALTDTRGCFNLPATAQAGREGWTLRVAAPWHSACETPLPPASEIEIFLVSRRRALLERLVHWSRRQGQPWSALAEPTPAQVLDSALRLKAPGNPAAVIDWARAVERSAYSEAVVDEATEREVTSLEPAP